MSSHVPFLAVSPDKQTSPKARDFASSTGSSTGSAKRSRGGSVKGAASKAVDKTKATAKKAEKEVKKTARQASRFGIKIAVWLAFPLIVITSLTLRLAAYTLVSEWAGIELASVSRELRQDWQVGAVFVWKVLELIGVWYAEYDCECHIFTWNTANELSSGPCQSLIVEQLAILLPAQHILPAFSIVDRNIFGHRHSIIDTSIPSLPTTCQVEQRRPSDTSKQQGYRTRLPNPGSHLNTVVNCVCRHTLSVLPYVAANTYGISLRQSANSGRRS